MTVALNNTYTLSQLAPVATSYATGANMWRTTGGGVTSTAIGASATAFNYFANAAVVGDTFVIGASGGIGLSLYSATFTVGTVLSAVGLTVVYEYSRLNGTWATLPNVIDNTNVFRNVGVNTIYFDMPDDVGTGQAPNAITGVRIRITGLTSITNGGANATTNPSVQTNIAYITGATVDLPAMYTQELAVEKELLPVMAAAATMTPYARISPMEWGETRLKIYITSYSVAGTVVISGLSSDGSAVSETLAVSANASLTTVNKYASINSSGIATAGTFSLRITQPRAGVVGKYHGDIRQFEIYKALVVLGDGTATVTTFTISSQNLNLKESRVYVSSNSVFTLGSYSGGEVVTSGSLSAAFTSVYYITDCLSGAAAGVCNLYGAILTSYPSAGRFYVNKGTLISVTVINPYTFYFGPNLTTISDMTFIAASAWGCGSSVTTSQILNDIKLNNCSAGYLSNAGGNTRATCQKLIRPNIISAGSACDYNTYGASNMLIIQDPIVYPLSARLRSTSMTGQTHVIWLDYSINIKVSVGAKAALLDKNLTVVFNVTADAAGDVSQQVVNVGSWTHVGVGASLAAVAFLDSEHVTNGPFTYRYRKYGLVSLDSEESIGVKINKSIILLANTVVLASYAIASAYTGIAINGVNKTITVTENHTLSELYDYGQYWAVNNMDYAEPLLSTDGNNFSSTYSLIINGCSLSGTGALNLGAASVTYINGSSTISITDSVGTHTSVNLLGFVSGSRVQLYDVAGALEIYNGVPSGTSVSVPMVWTTNKQIRVRVMYQNGLSAKEWVEFTDTITNNGLTRTITQVDDATYIANGIDGAAATECSITGTALDINIASGTNTISIQRVYAYEVYWLSTVGGIRDQDMYLNAIDQTHYVFEGGIQVKNANILPLVITGGILKSPLGNIVDAIDTGGGPIFVNFDQVVAFNGGDTAVLNEILSQVKLSVALSA